MTRHRSGTRERRWWSGSWRIPVSCVAHRNTSRCTTSRRSSTSNSQAGDPTEATWTAADMVIGNPPFLGCNKIRQELGDAYVDTLFTVFDGRVPRFADLVCYFFEKTRAQIAASTVKRAGLLATNSIRGG